MKKKIYIGLALAIMLGACKKDRPTPLASIQVIHAAVGFTPLKVNTTGNKVNFITFPDSLAFRSSMIRGIAPGNKSIEVGNYRADKVLASVGQNFEAGKMYSLYLAGTSPNLELVFQKDEPFQLYSVADSAFAVRAINLIPNSGPLNITLASAPGTVQFANLAYKQQAAFKKYPLTKKDATPGYAFKLSDEAGNVVASLDLSAATLDRCRFKPLTLVVSGSIGGTGTSAPSITPILNF